MDMPRLATSTAFLLPFVLTLAQGRAQNDSTTLREQGVEWQEQASQDHQQPKISSSKEAIDAEARLAELLAAVREGTHPPLDKAHPPSPHVGNLVDCSKDDPLDLVARVTGVTSGWMYNGGYTSGAVPRKDGATCVFLLAPFNRGLNVADASDFLLAKHLDLGLSESYRLQNNIPEPQDQADLERAIKASLERFGGSAASPMRACLPDLIDCKDYTRSFPG